MLHCMAGDARDACTLMFLSLRVLAEPIRPAPGSPKAMTAALLLCMLRICMDRVCVVYISPAKPLIDVISCTWHLNCQTGDCLHIWCEKPSGISWKYISGDKTAPHSAMTGDTYYISYIYIHPYPIGLLTLPKPGQSIADCGQCGLRAGHSQDLFILNHLPFSMSNMEGLARCMHGN